MEKLVQSGSLTASTRGNKLARSSSAGNNMRDN